MKRLSVRVRVSCTATVRAGEAGVSAGGQPRGAPLSSEKGEKRRVGTQSGPDNQIKGGAWEGGSAAAPYAAGA